MFHRNFPTLALAGVLAATAAQAETVAVPCMPISELKDPAKLRMVSHDEWIALRAAFYMAPNTPTNFPPGDQALVRDNEDGTASVVFVDGGDACAPMALGKDGIEMLKRLRAGIITHPAGRM